jgi:hypothetical protein
MNHKSGSSIESNLRKETEQDINFAIDGFLKNMQSLIDIYARPSMAFKILSTNNWLKYKSFLAIWLGLQSGRA